MFSYKFAAACFGAIVAAVAVVLTYPYPFAETNDGHFSKAAKLDVLPNHPGAECPKIAWPYGCEWHPAYLNGRTG